MSGRRLADLFSLASATRNIIRKHVEIQLNTATRVAATSSVTKAIKRDFRGSLVATDASREKSTPPPPSPNEDELLKGKDEHVFYERSESHSTPENPISPQGPVPPTKAQSQAEHGTREYTPSSASPRSKSKRMNPIQDHHVRKYSRHRTVPSATAGDTTESSNLRRNIDEEVYYEPKARTSPNKDFEPDHIPREAAEPPSPHDKLHDGINSEVYYNPEADSEPSKPKPRYKMSPSKVPSSQIGRLLHYGGLAAGLGFGAISESLRRATSSPSSESSPNLMFSPSNMELLVRKLSRMRGAALKLGQMISIQDSNILPQPIHDVLLRVQDSADYMPHRQMQQVMSNEFGPNWRDMFSEFEDVPMAAASIGQVHAGKMKDGRAVAVKIQYPGIADSIDSDLNNLSLLLTASRLLPKGLYLDKTIEVARTELAWECDYIREAECIRTFGKLLQGDPHYKVPKVLDEATGKNVITMERMWGLPIGKRGREFPQEVRDWLGTQILRLCLREIKEFKYMQTDPNWTNFLYNPKTKQLELLDFGASRGFSQEFVGNYIAVLKAAAVLDREAVREISLRLGYLTGRETEAMLDAHIDSVLTLAEPFCVNAPEVYDFSRQDVTARVSALIPVMLRHRLTPPPKETYSLHRKLSGAFLLCARVGANVRCRELFEKIVLGK